MFSARNWMLLHRLLLLGALSRHFLVLVDSQAIAVAVPRKNPCFSEPSSTNCLEHIALERGVSLDAARALLERARRLYASEESSPDALYDRPTVAIACLASAGTLRPGHDSDCSACGPACEAESRPEVCDLYCTPPPPPSRDEHDAPAEAPTDAPARTSSESTRSEAQPRASLVALIMNFSAANTFNIVVIVFVLLLAFVGVAAGILFAIRCASTRTNRFTWKTQHRHDGKSSKNRSSTGFPETHRQLSVYVQ